MINTLLSKFRHRFLRRFKNRIKPLFRLRELWEWEAESCNRCGSCFKLAYSLTDAAWNALYGSDGGCLCLNCAVEMAEEKGVEVRAEDVLWLCIMLSEPPFHDIVNRDQDREVGGEQ
ncbi:hypothetical protein LCGC14_0889890 [marine sediment metagenome]|uniref:Uncharacterized protein n=1 Tax=marine sediment metagenome TaxID=412755 RepID=A0A0F9RIW6_9ZZZZ